VGFNTAKNKLIFLVGIGRNITTNRVVTGYKTRSGRHESEARHLQQKSSSVLRVYCVIYFLSWHALQYIFYASSGKFVKKKSGNVAVALILK